MAKTFSSADEYLASLPPDRQKALSAVREVIRKNLNKGFEEGVGWGMISYHIPLSRYPDTYNRQPLGIAALGSQKGYMTVHLPRCAYEPAERERFEQAYRAAGKKLDMGMGCVRFKKLEDLPLDVIGDAILRITVEGFLALYEAGRAQRASGRPATAKKTPAPSSGGGPAKKASTSPMKSAPAAKKAAPKRSRTKQ